MRPRHLLLFVLAFALSAQEPPRQAEQIYVTAVDVVVDVRDKAGHLPAGLKPSDFVLLEDGVERSVVGATYLRRGAEATPEAAPKESRAQQWQTVLYFETELSSGVTRREIAQELIKQADTLTSLGTVDVVLANPTPHALLRDSRDAGAVRDALTKVMAVGGPNRLSLHRRQFIQETQGTSDLSALRARVNTTYDKESGTGEHRPVMDMGAGPANSPKNTADSPTDFDRTTASVTRVTMTTVRPYVQQEVALITHFQKSLGSWLSIYGRHTPRTLVLVSDGFDADPLEFYRSHLADRTHDAGFEEITKMTDAIGSTARTLATAGWTTISIPGDSNSDAGFLADASTSGTGRVHESVTAKGNPLPSSKLVVFHPLEPLQNIADTTGGSVVPNYGKVGDAIRSIDDRILLTYQVDRKPDGKAHRIQVRARDAGLKVRSTQWISSATLDEIAQARAIRLLDESASGDFPVEVTAEWNTPGATKSGTVRVIAKLDSIAAFLPANHRGQFRITMGVKTANKAYAVNSILPDQILTDASFRFRAPINVPADATAVLLVIEELGTGSWGIAHIPLQ